jgi:hypothetical protein
MTYRSGKKEEKLKGMRQPRKNSNWPKGKRKSITTGAQAEVEAWLGPMQSVLSSWRNEVTAQNHGPDQERMWENNPNSLSYSLFSCY